MPRSPRAAKLSGADQAAALRLRPSRPRALKGRHVLRAHGHGRPRAVPLAAVVRLQRMEVHAKTVRIREPTEEMMVGEMTGKQDAPVATAPAPDETIDPEISAPPGGAFGDGRALALAAADKDLARTVSAHVMKARGPRPSGGWNWASEAGDPCIRKLAYQRLYPERAIPESEDLAFVFRRGIWMEKEAKAELADAGYEIVEQDRPFEDKKLKVRGRIDGKVVLYRDHHATRPALEIKAYAPRIFREINSARDLLASDIPWLRRVPAQVVIYMMLDPTAGSEGILYLKDRLSGKPKQVVVALDERYAMWLWRRLRVLNAYVSKRKLPPRIEYDESVCGRCPFRAACLGELPAGAPPMVLDPDAQEELTLLLAEWERLKPMSKKFEEVDERVGEIVRGHEIVALAEWIVKGRWVDQDRLDSKAVPPDVRAKYTKSIRFWRKTVVGLKSKPSEESA